MRFEPVLLDQARRLRVSEGDRATVVTGFLDDMLMKLADSSVAPPLAPPRSLVSFVITSFRNSVIDLFRETSARERHSQSAEETIGAERLVRGTCSEFMVRAARGPAAEAGAGSTAAAALIRALLDGCSIQERQLLVWSAHRVPLRDCAVVAGDQLRQRETEIIAATLATHSRLHGAAIDTIRLRSRRGNADARACRGEDRQRRCGTNHMTREDQMPAPQPGIDAADHENLLRLLGAELDASGDCLAYESDEFSTWLELEVRGRASAANSRASARMAQQAAKRVQARISAARVGVTLPILPLVACAARVVGNVSQIAQAASESGCAPWVESLAVAAGEGREIWDEPCEQWVELPRDATAGDHIALSVSGDSMTPWLRRGDVILVSTRKPVSRDCIVVARRAEDGYVVKHVTRCGRATLELSSFNSAYTPFVIERTRGAIVGVVVAKLVREERAS
jgi:SOS-response transcriptional repressor LexA